MMVALSNEIRELDLFKYVIQKGPRIWMLEDLRVLVVVSLSCYRQILPLK
jgi:hypothetical protein